MDSEDDISNGSAARPVQGKSGTKRSRESEVNLPLTQLSINDELSVSSLESVDRSVEPQAKRRKAEDLHEHGTSQGNMSVARRPTVDDFSLDSIVSFDSSTRSADQNRKSENAGDRAVTQEGRRLTLPGGTPAGSQDGWSDRAFPDAETFDRIVNETVSRGRSLADRQSPDGWSNRAFPDAETFDRIVNETVSRGRSLADRQSPDGWSNRAFPDADTFDRIVNETVSRGRSLADRQSPAITYRAPPDESDNESESRNDRNRDRNRRGL